MTASKAASSILRVRVPVIVCDVDGAPVDDANRYITLIIEAADADAAAAKYAQVLFARALDEGAIPDPTERPS